MIGPFNFDYDDACESDVLHSDQVYKDLKELEKILGKCQSAQNVNVESIRSKSKKK